MRYISCFTQHMRSPMHPMAKSFSFFAVNETDVEAESTTKGSPGEPCLESSREFSSSHPISRSTYYAANGKDMGDLHDHIKSSNVTWRFRAGFHRKLNGHPTSNYAIITFFANRLTTSGILKTTRLQCPLKPTKRHTLVQPSNLGHIEVFVSNDIGFVKQEKV
ncbi:hypothetical protein BBBOND_0205300 [Babesia bigemina]|uniref:Uncharacterized protein n=1 Tax=Babesia bigemina TaxID=5866 RepID=A0A061D5T7_BABBI|nr:hypothetical protein BBBOND_0205300 [Babesia bigemina]CDR95372.1 hypothetical protein BBBOND_0205300 [Babesia bigemina]|eukprot:XP_012767558.1 hypothetical protein BBBOND_0205300 [Babesia bigemina]